MDRIVLDSNKIRNKNINKRATIAANDNNQKIIELKNLIKNISRGQDKRKKMNQEQNNIKEIGNWFKKLLNASRNSNFADKEMHVVAEDKAEIHVVVNNDFNVRRTNNLSLEPLVVRQQEKSFINKAEINDRDEKVKELSKAEDLKPSKEKIEKNETAEELYLKESSGKSLNAELHVEADIETTKGEKTNALDAENYFELSNVVVKELKRKENNASAESWSLTANAEKETICLSNVFKEEEFSIIVIGEERKVKEEFSIAVGEENQKEEFSIINFVGGEEERKFNASDLITRGGAEKKEKFIFPLAEQETAAGNQENSN
jgi:hypothetical protein